MLSKRIIGLSADSADSRCDESEPKFADTAILKITGFYAKEVAQLLSNSLDQSEGDVFRWLVISANSNRGSSAAELLSNLRRRLYLRAHERMDTTE